MKNITVMLTLLLVIAGSVNGQTSDKPDRDTINLTEKDGTRYRMIVLGDKLPEFFVNDKKIDRQDLGDYDEIVGKMQLMLTDRKRKAKSSKNNK